MGRAFRAIIIASVALVCGLLAKHVGAELMTFETPHVVRPPAATLAPALAAQIDARASASKATSPTDLVTFSLRETAARLHFGLSHPTSLRFDFAEREGNCIEYAELFATIFNRERGNVDARAWVVRSDAKVLGRTMTNPAWKDHDWVLVVVKGASATAKLFVDPTMNDVGMSWDISSSVRGEVRAP